MHSSVDSRATHYPGKSKLSTSEQTRISRRTNHGKDSVAALRARFSLSRQISLKIVESLTDLRAFALAASADIRRCEIVTHGAEHSNVLDHSPVPAERRVMASIVTANFDRNNVTPIRRERTQISVRPVAVAGRRT